MPTILVVLSACSPCPSGADVPVRRAEGSAVAAITDGLRAFANDAVVDVCVDHVRVTDLDGLAGRYNRVTRGVVLDRSMVHAPHVLRHELCHAADFQHDLVRSDESLFPTVDTGPDHLGAHEGFAAICELGPETLAPLWDDGACNTDPRLSGVRFVRDEVYALPRTMAPEAAFEPIARLANLDAWVEHARLRETVTGNLSVTLEGRDAAQEIFTVDPWSGEIVGGVEDLVPWGDEGPEAPGFWSAGSKSGGRLDAGTSILSAFLHLPNGPVARTFALTAEGVAPVEDHCPNETTRYFVVDDELWSSQIEGRDLLWGRWIRSD